VDDLTGSYGSFTAVDKDITTRYSHGYLTAYFCQKGMLDRA
jgi:hypothetical protein